MNKLITEGSSQRFLKVRIQTLAKAIDSLAKAHNSWHRPAKFSITNQVGEAFEFEGIKSGSFSEPPMCEDYEIHFNGTFNKERELSPWEIGNIEVRFLNRSQCL